SRIYDEEVEKILDVPRQIDMLLRQARVFEEELGQVERAIATYRRVLDADPDNKRAITALDRLYSGTERGSEPADILRRQVRLVAADPDQVIATTFRLGQLYETALQDFRQAIDSYREILALDPSHAPTLGALELLFTQGVEQHDIAQILEPLYRAA